MAAERDPMTLPSTRRRRRWSLIRDFRSDERGSGMVEFTVVASVFSLILLGILEFGMASWSKNSVASDSREAARYAIVHGASSGRVATADSVTNYIKARTSLDTIRVTTTWHPDTTPGSVVWVKVEHDVPRRGPFLAAHTDSSTSKMVILN